MSTQTDSLISLLKPFGLSPEESLVYLTLLEKGNLSALSISRLVHLARTKVYRLLDSLITKGLVATQTSTSGFKFIANHPSQLELLLSDREQQLISLKSSLPNLISTLETTANSSPSISKILYYQGTKGLSQVNWNLLNAHGQFFSYEVVTAESYMPHAEAENLRKHLSEKKITVTTITNQTSFKPFTDISEIINYWQISYIPKEILNITTDIFIYNNVYAVCNYLDNGDIFCFEIYNQRLADFQKQIFQNFWSQSKPLTLIGSHGQAELENN